MSRKTSRARVLSPSTVSPEDTLLQHNAQHIADVVGRGCLLAELVGPFGPRCADLVSRLLAPAAYVVVDPERARLTEYVESVARQHPQLDVLPVPATVSSELTLPRCSRPIGRKVVYFAESGLERRGLAEVRRLLLRFAVLVHRGGGLLIGLTRKDREALEWANRDELGQTIFDQQRTWGAAEGGRQLALWTPTVEP